MEEENHSAKVATLGKTKAAFLYETVHENGDESVRASASISGTSFDGSKYTAEAEFGLKHTMPLHENSQENAHDVGDRQAILDINKFSGELITQDEQREHSSRKKTVQDSTKSEAKAYSAMFGNFLQSYIGRIDSYMISHSRAQIYEYKKTLYIKSQFVKTFLANSEHLEESEYLYLVSLVRSMADVPFSQICTKSYSLKERGDKTKTNARKKEACKEVYQILQANIIVPKDYIMVAPSYLGEAYYKMEELKIGLQKFDEWFVNSLVTLKLMRDALLVCSKNKTQIKQTDNTYILDATIKIFQNYTGISYSGIRTESTTSLILKTFSRIGDYFLTESKVGSTSEEKSVLQSTIDKINAHCQIHLKSEEYHKATNALGVMVICGQSEKISDDWNVDPNQKNIHATSCRIALSQFNSVFADVITNNDELIRGGINICSTAQSYSLCDSKIEELREVIKSLISTSSNEQLAYSGEIPFDTNVTHIIGHMNSTDVEQE